jgi:hypothetical protein
MNAAEREQKLASLHAQSDTGTGIAAPHGETQTAAPVAAAPVVGAPVAAGHHDAAYAQQPIAGQQPIPSRPLLHTHSSLPRDSRSPVPSGKCKIE